MREELHRIDRLIAEPHFKVQVRARNPPGPAEIADILALLDLLAFPDSEFVQMGITQGDAFSGIDVDGQSIGACTRLCRARKQRLFPRGFRRYPRPRA